MTALLKLDKNGPVQSRTEPDGFLRCLCLSRQEVVTHGGQLSWRPWLCWTGSGVLSFGELRSIWRFFFLWAALSALWEGPAVWVNQTCSAKPGDEHPLVATAGIASVWTRPASSQDLCPQQRHRRLLSRQPPASLCSLSPQGACRLCFLAQR